MTGIVVQGMRGGLSRGYLPVMKERLRRSDVLITGVVVVLGQVDVWVPKLAIANMVGSRPVDALGYLACSLALLWRRPSRSRCWRGS